MSRINAFDTVLIVIPYYGIGNGDTMDTDITL